MAPGLTMFVKVGTVVFFVRDAMWCPGKVAGMRFPGEMSAYFFTSPNPARELRGYA